MDKSELAGNTLENTPSNDRLTEINSDEPEYPPPSTLYDPSVLHLSPKEQRKNEAKSSWNQAHSKKKSDDSSNAQDSASLPRESTAIRIDGNIIRLPEEEENFDDDREMELCCNGNIPLYPSLFAMCVVSIIIGFICLALAAVVISSQDAEIVGVSSLNELVISGKYLFGVGQIILSFLLLLAGSLGSVVFFRKWRRAPSSAKVGGIIYNSISFLISLLCLLLFVVVILSWVLQNQRVIFSEKTWSNLVKSDPAYACSTEVRLDCAGFRIAECSFDFNNTKNLFCPGHFCVDFCQIDEENVKQQALCTGCRESKKSLDFSFTDCKLFEQRTSLSKGCDKSLSSDLSEAYQRLALVAILSFLWVIVTTVALVYLIFCT